MKNILNFLLIALLFVFSSCSDFLDEETKGVQILDYYNCPQGIEDLVTGVYADGLCFHFNYEWAVVSTLFGTDEFTHAASGVGIADHFNTYSNAFNSVAGTTNPIKITIWNNMFTLINACNLGIERTPNVYSAAVDSAKRKNRMGEFYFMRAFCYFKLVKQFGGVPIILNTTNVLNLDASRASAEQVYAQIISDWQKAVTLLPPTTTELGRLTKPAAQHFLAKAYLYRASELNASFSKSTDLDSAIYFANEVITKSDRVLATNFFDLFAYAGPNGANESNKEIILAAQFDGNQSTKGRYGNQMHLYFSAVYQDLAGMVRDIINGREFQRCAPNNYALDVYDRVNDSRFWKSFKLVWFANNTGTIPKWTKAEIASLWPAIGDTVGTGYEGTHLVDSSKATREDGKVIIYNANKFENKDTSIMYIVNKIGDARFTKTYAAKMGRHTFIRYLGGVEGSTNRLRNQHPSLAKYFDPFRTTVADQFGQRDGILARLAETHLIRAEAYGRKGDYVNALIDINLIRKRGAFKNGEVRGSVYTTAAGVVYGAGGPYYLVENITPGTTTSTATEMEASEDNFTPGTIAATKELFSSDVTTKTEGFIHFILNERSRELMGEVMRWEDLSRTKTLAKRVKEFNPDGAANVTEPKHLLRPIPQEFLDNVTKNGSPLTASEKQAMQNPGY